METLQSRRVKAPKYLFYNIDDDIFVSKLSEIKEVVNDLELGDVPLKSSFTLGMSSLRGEIISVLSLGKLLTKAMGIRDGSKTSLVDPDICLDRHETITLIIEHNELKYGLAIDSIKQVGILETRNLKESREHAQICGHYSVDNRIATVINLESLLKEQCP